MKKIIIALTAIGINLSLAAQDDLLNDLESSNPTSVPVIATFKGTRIINAHTVETVKKSNLDFRVAHRFGSIGTKNARHSLYGFDVSEDINIAFEYGVSDRLTVGFSRSKRAEALQGLIKYRLMTQTSDDSRPVSIALMSSNVLTAVANSTEGYRYTTYTDRMSYVNQAIIARKFSDKLSLQISPTIIHRNWVFDAEDENTNFSLGFGGRIKLTKRSAIVGDVFYTVSKYRQNRKGIYLMPPLSLGYEIETGGHVFTLMFSNASGILENDYLVNTFDSWGKGQFKFCFLISRNFRV